LLQENAYWEKFGLCSGFIDSVKNAIIYVMNIMDFQYWLSILKHSLDWLFPIMLSPLCTMCCILHTIFSIFIAHLAHSAFKSLWLNVYNYFYYLLLLEYNNYFYLILFRLHKKIGKGFFLSYCISTLFFIVRC